MSAPSIVHEDRVALLADMATLAGFSVGVELWFAERPDVVCLHHLFPALLIGDAKATESPRSIATRGRLRSYVEAGAEWLAAGFSVDVALVHGPAPRNEWLSCLDEVVRSVGLSSDALTCTEVDEWNWISTVALSS